MRTLKLYLFALAGVPVGLYVLVKGEFLGGLVFLGICAGCALYVLDSYLPEKMPRWVLTAALWCFGASMVALVVVVIRAASE